jgi:predicted HAD superfamily phosphohydrolase YqeG
MKFFSELNTPFEGKLIFLDIDGTLTEEGSDKIKAPVLRKIKELKAKNELHLCTNSKDISRNRRVAKTCGVPYLETKLRKPNKKLLDLVGNEGGKPLLVIGNLAIIDGRLARNSGGDFIQVKTLVGRDESWIDKVLYLLDAKIFSRLI